MLIPSFSTSRTSQSLDSNVLGSFKVLCGVGRPEDIRGPEDTVVGMFGKVGSGHQCLRGTVIGGVPMIHLLGVVGASGINKKRQKLKMLS